MSDNTKPIAALAVIAAWSGHAVVSSGQFHHLASAISATAKMSSAATREKRKNPCTTPES